ncbi:MULTISPECIES: hypothetical protein [unclassified Ensifer]|uniref:hypothetical protein n=1 Tax=unclassified Ensifer TaxID=2633371 RepID=UPI00137975C2|nr:MULTISPECIES: hypothetical protein [unclassified Ensifer]
MTEKEREIAIHFFNTCGLSAMTESFYLEVIEDLRKENERLERLVERAKVRGLLGPEN